MVSFLSRLASLVCLVLAMAGPARAADLELPAGAHVIEARINGHPVRLRVDAEAPGYILLNPAAIARVGLRPSMTRARFLVGPIRLTGRTKSTRVTIGTRTDERRVIWIDRDVVTDADGMISPADLPFDRVTMHLRAPGSGEQLFRLPLEFNANSGLFLRQPLGGQEVSFKIAAANPSTLVTAAAGALIAAQHAGTWAGDAQDHPIRFGIARPTRPLILGNVFVVGGLALDRMLVRISDNRGNAVLPPDHEADPDEMIVTADTQRQRARYTVFLGADWLAGCSSMTWDNGARIMTISCRAS